MTSEMKSDARWVAAISSASMNAPVLIDAFTLMVPFASHKEHYASIDQSWRVSVGEAFWTLSRNERNFVLTHLCMHMLSRQFQRASSANIPLNQDSIHAMSLEIDPAISMMDNVDEPEGYVYHNDSYASHRSMEEYYSLIVHGKGDEDDKRSIAGSTPKRSDDESEEQCNSQDKNNNEETHDDDVQASRDDREDNASVPSSDTEHHESDSKDGRSSSSNDDSDDIEENIVSSANAPSEDDDVQESGERPPDDVADDADLHGIERPSPVSMMDAMQNTATRAKDGSSFGIGTSSSLITGLIVSNIAPPKNNWREILGRIMSISKNRKSYQSQERTFSKINVRASAFLDDIILPGLTSYAPKICMAIDTSGSMRNDDIMNALGEAEGIITTGASSHDFSVFCVDTQVKNIQPVSSLDEVDITGGGGTDMAPAFEYISSLSQYQRPDVFVLATDGFVPWEHCRRFMPAWNCTIILLIVNEKGYRQVPKWMFNQAEVLDISA